MRKSIHILLLILIASTTANAQMFTVEDEQQSYTNPFAPYIRAGVKLIDFTYQDDPNSNQLTQEEPFAVTSQAATIAFESYGFTLEAAIANDLTGLDSHNYFNLGIGFQTPFYFIRKPNLLIGVPIRLSSQLTSVGNDAVNNEFSQTNLSAGAGAIVQLQSPDVIGASIQLIPNYGFSSASGGFIGGSAYSLEGKARINFYNLIFGKNLSIGYDYNFTSYDIDEEQYDYDFTGHTLTIGITL